MRVYVVFGEGMEACLSSKGTLLWSHDEPSARGERRSGPAVGDVDGDGDLEVITATDDFQVIVRDAWTGEEEWRWEGRAGVDQTNSFALAYFDRLDQLDLICADGSFDHITGFDQRHGGQISGRHHDRHWLHGSHLASAPGTCAQRSGQNRSAGGGD